jgi:N-methylhydantoinase A
VKRIGVDTGGTFTDSICWDEGTGIVAAAKLPTDRGDPAASVVASLTELAAQGLSPDSVDYLFHGTTVATNIAVELSGGRIAYLASRGCRDIPEIGRLWRSADQLYELNAPAHQIVARRDRFEVGERLDWRGSVVEPLDEEGVREIAARIRARGIESVAVCFLHSYADARHEEAAKRILEEELPGARVSISSAVLSDHREYERSSTTIFNAYLAPGTSGYLDRLDEAVRRWNPSSRLWVMQSNGGVISSGRAADLPATLLLSGPSGGVVATRELIAASGVPNAITLDMGGTSCDVAFLEGGQLPVVRERELHGMPIRIPAVDVLTIGSGGGSIARVNSAGQFTVGPQSAGSMPGPACYGRGGDEPTVTDANLVLGVLGEDQLLGSEVRLQAEEAFRVCERLAKRLGVSTLEAAWGIRRLADTAMAGAVRTVSVERGFDPRDAVLVAFGAAGPMHAVAIAEEIGIPKVAIPAVPGCHCAVGHVMADVVRDYVSTQLTRLHAATSTRLASAFEGLVAEARSELDDEGIAAEHQEFELGVDVRYVGQQASLTVPVRRSKLGDGALDDVAASFHALHEKLYGFAAHRTPLEAAAARVRAIGRLPRRDGDARPDAASNGNRPSRLAERKVHFGPMPRDAALTAVYAREELAPGMRFDGPAVLTQADATTLVPPGYTASVDGRGQIWLETA